VWTGSYEIDDSLESLGRVLVMTPEKLDYVLRARLEDDPRTEDLEARLRLLVLDECHLIGSEGRGLTYELLVTRVKARLPRVQICAMSAVLGDPEPLTHWITGQGDQSIQSSWKPGRARVIVYQRDGSVVDDRHQELAILAKWSVAKKAAASVTESLVESGEWPVLVMESQRPYAETAAKQLFAVRPEGWDDGDDASEQRTRAANLASILLEENSPLPSMLLAGIAFHHAGLPPVLRNAIESLVRGKHIRVVCSTTTLAEGIDLPFRVVVCPHINYESGYMPRQLFQNIAGRAGRAFSGVEGWIAFLEPGTEKLNRHLWDVLLAEGDAPLELHSRVPQLGRALVKPDDWRRDWRYQSQVLGLLGDGARGQEQIANFLAGTFAAASAGARGIAGARRRGQSVLEQMETSPALAVAASPYRLTDLGSAACLTGLSIDSVRVLVREIEHPSAEWASQDAWIGLASAELASHIAQLSFAPLESYSEALGMPGRYSLFAAAVRHWRDDHDHDLFEAIVSEDISVMRSGCRDKTFEYWLRIRPRPSPP
jgi:DEAD/DEAH box helicase